ncbi:MAG TPA: site-specific integrase, partial [Acidimicrobiia bacterium]|nr:site-specific integrase [Acidimicrobiia bacterium]
MDRLVAAPSMSSVEGVIAAFDHHLAHTCGLAAATRHGYRREGRALLVARFGDDAVDLSALRPDEIRDFVTARAKHLCPTSVNGVSNAVRALVRFLALQGFRSAGAAAAVPRAAVWRLTQVPCVLSDAEVDSLLGAFDRTTALGRRDYAIALCRVALGRRAGEVAAITLDDIDWRAGTLALPTGLGRAMARLSRVRLVSV